jgi:hypothetical protein
MEVILMTKVRTKALVPFNKVLGGVMVVGHPDHYDPAATHPMIDEEYVDALVDEGLVKRAPQKMVEESTAAGGEIKPYYRMNKEELHATAAEKGVTVPEGATNKQIAALLEAAPLIDASGNVEGQSAAAARVAPQGDDGAAARGSHTNAVIAHPPEALVADTGGADTINDLDDDAAPGSGSAG